MPFLRFSRDKRGYEHTYLVQATNRRGKPVRPRILYWYRTPPGVRLGRVPFDDDVRKMLEAQNPGVVFDWTALANTPFPAQEPEDRRERRRAEKAAKQARRGEESSEAEETVEGQEEPSEILAAPPADGVGELLLEPDAPGDAAFEDVEVQAAPEPIEADEPREVAPGTAPMPEGAGPDSQAPRKRRRRGGRRRRARLTNQSGAPEEAVSSPPDGRDIQASEVESSDSPDSSSEEQE